MKRAGTKFNVPSELPCVNYKIATMGSAAGVLRCVLKFKELVRIRKTLTGALFETLREQFRVIDSDGSGFISLAKAKRMNVLLAPHLSLEEADADVSRLFQVATAGDYISELQWLQAWAAHVRHNNFSLALVQDFVESFDHMRQHSNLEAVMGSHCASQFPAVFSAMMKWKNKSLATVQVKQENERFLKSRERSFENKVHKIKTLMTDTTRVARTGRENGTKNGNFLDPKTKPSDL